MHDLLTPLTSGAAEGSVVVARGRTVRGLATYPNATWYADRDRADEGHAQTSANVHLRNCLGTIPKWHRSSFTRHYLSPTVACSFRIDGHDPDHVHGGNVGFKLSYLHQDTATLYHVQLKVNGECSIFKEARDGVDRARGKYGHTLAAGTWRHEQGVRRHLLVDQLPDGTIRVEVDGTRLLEATDPHPIRSGQVGFRLDGVDCSLHSLVVG